MDKNYKISLFRYIGNKRWRSDEMEWNESEMITLYFVLNEALEKAQSYEERRDIVYLLEKIFRLTETIELNEIRTD